MKNILITILVFLLSLSSFSELSPQNIKGLDDAVKVKDLSLIRGMVFKKGGILENAYEMTPKADSHEVLKVIPRLFTRVDWEFMPTRQGRNPASHYHPYLLGRIVAELDALRNTWSQIAHTSEKDLANHTHKLSQKTKALFDKKDRDTKIKWLSDAYSEEAKKRIQTVILKDPGFNERREAYKQKFLAKNKPLFDEGKSSTFENSVALDAKYFIDALRESNEDLSIFKILTAFTYDKIENRADALIYLKGIYEQASSYHGNKYAQLLLNNASLLYYKSFEQKWLLESFNPNDLTLDLHKETNYELAVFSVLQKLKGSSIAPYFSKFGTATLSTGSTFTDCGSNSLLNFYRVLFANENDLSISLPNFGTPHAKLNEYFTTKSWKTKANLSDLENMKSINAKNAWAEVTSNLAATDLRYVTNNQSERYEIDSGFDNMNRFIRELFGVADLDEFIKKYNEANNKEIRITRSLEENKFGSITFHTMHGIFLWSFTNGHFEFSEVLGGSAFSPSLIETMLKKKPPFVDLVSLFPLSIYKINRLADERDYVLFFHKLRDEDQVVSYSSLLKYAQRNINRQRLVESISSSLFAKLITADAKYRYLSALPDRILINHDKTFFTRSGLSDFAKTGLAVSSSQRMLERLSILIRFGDISFAHADIFSSMNLKDKVAHNEEILFNAALLELKGSDDLLFFLKKDPNFPSLLCAKVHSDMMNAVIYILNKALTRNINLAKTEKMLSVFFGYDDDITESIYKQAFIEALPTDAAFLADWALKNYPELMMEKDHYGVHFLDALIISYDKQSIATKFINKYIESKLPLNLLNDNRTLVETALSLNKVGLAKMLLQSGAPISAGVGHSYNLHFANQLKETELAQLFIDSGIRNTHSSLACGNTPLHAAALCDNLDLVPFYFAQDKRVDIVNNLGETPLHLAVRTSNLNAVRFLLLNGANPNAKDNEGLTPLDGSQINNSLGSLKDKDIEELLKKSGGQMTRPLAACWWMDSFL